MANKNQLRMSVIRRKEQKALGVKVNSSFGAKGNLHKSPRNYQKVAQKARLGTA